MHAHGCLEPEVLAAYVDHGLSLVERARAEAHLASCPQCTALLAGVVRTAAEIAPALQRTVEPVEATPPAWRRAVANAAAAAAAVIAVLAAPSVMEPWLERDAGLVSLAGNVGEHRSVLGRLTGGYPHAPLDAASAGGQDARASGTDRVLLTAGRIRESVGEMATPSRMHALGVSQMLEGRYDDAAQLLLAASREQPANARYLNDVATVHLERARLGLRPDDLPRALAAADRARRLDPSLHEAWFNRALAMSALQLTDQAKSAWTEYLRRDSSSPWAGEARKRLEDLSKPTPAAAWEAIEARLHQTIDATTADAAVRAHVTEARHFTEDVLFANWAEAALSGGDTTVSLERLHLMAEAFVRVAGEALYADAVSAIDRAAARGPQVVRQLAEAHATFSTAARTFANDRYAAAQPGFISAQNNFAAAGSPFALRAAVELGAVAYAIGRNDEAAELLDASYQRARDQNYLFTAGRAAWFQGLVAFGQARLGDTQERYEAALTAFDRSGDAEQVASAHNLLASLFGYLGNEQLAWKHREAAMPALSISRSLRLRYGLLAGAMGAAHRQDVDAALILQESVVQTAQEWGRPIGVAESLAQRAELLAETGRREEAARDIAAARAALAQIPDEAFRRRIEVTVLAAESSMSRSHAPAAAAYAAERALRLVDERRDRRRLPQLNLLLAKANIARGHTAAAEQALDAGIRAFDAERLSLNDEARVSVLDDSWELFETAVQVAIRKGDLARAFAMSERARVRTLGEHNRTTIRSLAEVENSLAPDEAIVGLNQFDDELAVWLIRAAGTSVYLRDVRKVDAVKFLAQQHDEIWRQVHTPRASAELYDQILRPIRLKLEGVSRMVVVPDTTYETAQFSALWDRTRRRFIIEDVSINVAPNASMLARVGRAPTASSSEPLVFSGPDQQSVSDATEIAALYPSAVLRTGANATRAQFLKDLDQSAVVHLATRTVANTTFPLLSAFAVQDDPGFRYSGRLLGRDIAALQTSRTKLVVIDELDTTRTTQGEGTLSLARAFVAAGVPAVVGTLPGADDAASRDLMVGFHQRMAANMTATKALTELQRNVLQSNGRRLGAWSALVLYGSDR